MLTFILQARSSSLLIIDEPDIYLHSDLQRQLVRVLEELGPAVLLATHSTEIISEVEADSILHISPKWKSAKRISNTKELHDIFLALGSRFNPALTELAKTRVVLFLEGQDFKILSRFARKLNLDNLSSRSGFAIIPSHGFNPQKVMALAEGMEAPLDLKLFKAVVLDRDYRSDAEVQEIRGLFEKEFDIVAIHSCKEIENFLLK
jgi:predicted ATP-dependent endonuclease of OLD family